MTHAEYLEWIAFDKHEPIGNRRGDYHTAMLMLILASIHRGKGKKSPKLESFLPDWWDDRKSPTALVAKFRAATANTRTESSGNNIRNTRSQAGR